MRLQYQTMSLLRRGSARNVFAVADNSAPAAATTVNNSAINISCFLRTIVRN
jgi:hypothetical protein